MNDALTVARWCWPQELPDGWIWCDDGTYSLAIFDPDSADCNGNDQALHGVRDAERVLIERGHADAYGKAIARELDQESYLPGASFAVTTSWFMLAMIATLSPAARIRAMAAVIRTLESK